MLRQPAVAGSFYPAGRRELQETLSRLIPTKPEPRPALAVVSPHAGYIYSGELAGRTLAAARLPRRVILMGPNHRGLGGKAALMGQGAWQTPLGQVELDSQLAGLIAAKNPLAAEDAIAHEYEHSLEVQVPFLQTLRPDLLLTPLCLGWLSLEECRQLGWDLAGAIKELGQEVLLLASTDMTHMEPAEQAKTKDMLAIGHILELDPAGLYETVRGRGITMCGVLPTTVALYAALELGAGRAELIGYANSGQASGDYASVVGYAGLVIS